MLAAVAPMPAESIQTLPEFRPSDVKPIVEAAPVYHPVDIQNGRFLLDGKAVWGSQQTEAWWHGDTSLYTAAAASGSSVSRFMPGVTAPGETEDLKQMVARLQKRGITSIQINPGLWYEHRRDSHTMERRTDGDVWAPFYEVPWARSGQGVAWDGLSKFDLSRYNPWYFEREREFAKDASKAGLVVFYDLYNTHNVLEIGPHWIDYAWRPANNINDTGLPEPPPLKPHGRNDVGNDSTAPTTRRCARCTTPIFSTHSTSSQIMPNVIFGVAYQYAGPLAFEQFFQDTVREWEESHGKHVRIALTTSKQTTDAILEDPIRSKQIAVVDMRYWEYRPDGTLFAPKAGENHAFRELIAERSPASLIRHRPPLRSWYITKCASTATATRQVALMPMEDDAGPIPILMGGASSPSGLVTQAPAPVPTSVEQASAMYPHGPAEAAPPPPGPNVEKLFAQFVPE